MLFALVVAVILYGICLFVGGVIRLLAWLTTEGIR